MTLFQQKYKWIIQIRFVVSLVIVLIVASTLALPVMDNMTLRWFSRDLDTRSQLLTNALSDSIIDSLQTKKLRRLQPLMERTVQDERLYALGICDDNNVLVSKTRLFPTSLTCTNQLLQSIKQDRRIITEGGALHLSIYPIIGSETEDALPTQNASKGQTTLLLLHDLSFVEKRSHDTKRYLIGLICLIGLTIAIITILIAHFSLHGWIRSIKDLLSGKSIKSTPLDIPFASEIRSRLKDLEDALRRSWPAENGWTAERLKNFVQTNLHGEQIIVVSNREPYIHEFSQDSIVVKHPASGLVTAIEPVVRTCSGTWIAHGSGSADSRSVDKYNRVAVPPESPEYTLRRVWLTQEEENGYYYGFSNEGLWPLCHVAHVRPIFREADWLQYKRVNQIFADAVVAEAHGEDPIVLIQDYHLALAPAMIRQKLPHATIISFWHIPWPNAEAFGICPWRKELLSGLLGSTVIGFHTKFHCKNFIENVDRYLEARIEQEHALVYFQSQETLIESYPISIEWPNPTKYISTVKDCRHKVRKQLNLSDDICLALGVDRFDYTKGILERLYAVERFLEKWPSWVGHFSFIQVAAPTRAALNEYQNFQLRVTQLVEKINQRFGSDGYQPIYLLPTHHEPEALNTLYRAADVCLVTSLHDGMNLVCKEFIAARDDACGVLILSKFTGAAKELTESLLVNPYHVEETADAIYHAVTMPIPEQQERMTSLRQIVQEHNVFRWAAHLLMDATRLRLKNRIQTRVNRFRQED